jgi:hypothetical protein
LEGGDVKWLIANKDDEDLQTNHNNVDSQEEVILRDAFQDIESIVQPAVA